MAESRERTLSVHNLVVPWLLAEGYKTRDGEMPDASWAIVAEADTGISLVVRQTTARPDALLIGGAVQIDSLTARKLSEIDDESREAFLWGLRLRLLEMGTDFRGLDDPLQRVEIQMQLLAEDLNHTIFSDRLRLVRNAILAVVWDLRRLLGQGAAAPQAVASASIN